MTDMQTSLPLLIVRPSIINPVINFSTHLWPVKWNALWLYLCLVHSIPSPPLLMQHMHQPYHKWYDPLHIITWPYWFIDLDITCSSLLPWSIGAKSSTCPSLLQPAHQAKPHLDLLHLSHMTQCHVSYAISSFITCVSFATSPSHLTSMACIAHTHVPID